MRLVKIEWVDSFGCEPNWSPLDDIADVEHVCFSVGFLMSEGENSTVVIPHYSPVNTQIGSEGSGCGDMSIPNRSIISITDLVPVDKGDKE